MNCGITGTSDERLQDYINKYGQAEGLKRYLKESLGKGYTNFEDIPADKEVYGVKFIYKYSLQDANGLADQIREDLGKQYVNVIESKDTRNRVMYKIIITNPQRLEGVDELSGIDMKNPFDILTAYLKGQRRIKYSRLSKISADIEELKRAGDKAKLRVKEAQKVRLLNDIAELEKSVDEFTISREAQSLKVLAAKQLAWVSSILTKESLTASEITEANYILDMWRDIREILYDETEEVPADMEEAFREIRSIADTGDLFGNLYRVMAQHLADRAKYKSPEELIREFHKIEDLSLLRQWGLDLAHTGIKLITNTDTIIRNSLARSDREIKEVTKKLVDTFKNLKDKGKDVNLFWQRDKDGNINGNMVNRYSDLWWSSRKQARNKLNAAMKAANESGLPESAIKRMKRKAFREYLNFIKANAESIDVRFFITEGFTDGSFTKDSYIEYLNGVFGVARTQEIIAQATDSYDKYTQDLEDITESFDEKLASGEITEEQRNDQLNEWIAKNSPEVWLKQNEPGATEFIQGYNKYVIVKPKKFINNKPSGWYDSNYEKIENDADMLEAYNYIRELMSELMSYLPKYLTKDQDVHAGFLPRVKKELLNDLSLKDFIGGVATMKEDWIQSITSEEGLDNRHLEIDPVTKKPYKNIPVAFITNIPVEDRSLELDKVLSAFAKMAIEYKWKSKIEDSVLLTNRFVDNISTSEKRKQTNADELKALKMLLDYSIDAQLYNQSKAEEGKSDKTKLFQGNTYLAKEDIKSKVDAKYKVLREKDLSEDEILEQLKEEFQEDVEIVSKKKKHNYLKNKAADIEEKFYNQEITEEQYNEMIAPIEEEAKLLGRSVIWSKVGDKFLRWNQALALGFNPFSAVNNYMFGVTSNIIWSAGNTDFTPKDMWRAFGMMWRSVLNLKDRKMDKVANLIAKFDILQEAIEYNSGGKNATLEKIKNSPYVLLKSGDYMIKGQTFIAMMLKEKIVDLNGRTRSLYDAFDNEGNWKSDEFGDSKAWDGDVTNEEDLTKFLEFRNKATGLIKKLHGNFDPRSPVMYKKFILGRMLGQFRFSWMAEGVEQRFGKRRFDELLGREVEGRWRTYYNMGFTSSLKTLGRLMLRQSSAFKGVRAQDRAITEENMRRNLMEIYLYAVLFSIYFMLKNGMGDDDDDDKTKYLVMNMLQRVMADTTFYITPGTFTSIIQDPIPLIKVYSRSSKALKSAFQLIIDEDLTEAEIEQKWLNITNAAVYINQYNRFKYMSEKVREY